MSHYNDEYFQWQRLHGEFGGKANLFKFQKFINKDSRVIDFGSGGGYLLANLNCKDKIGVEINTAAKEFSNKSGIQSVENPDKIDDDWADVIISNHALEHVENPLFELRRLRAKLKVGGTIVFVVPHEKRKRYDPTNIHQHLFTWSEINLGNLFTRAGFEVVEVRDLKYTNPPKFLTIRKMLGDDLFYSTGKIYHKFRTLFNFLYPNDITQIRIVAKRNS